MKKQRIWVGFAGAVLIAAAVLFAAERAPFRESAGVETAAIQKQAVPVTGKPTMPAGEPRSSQTSSAQADAIAPLPANATSIPDEDLLRLAGMVDLAGASDHRPDKVRWTQALAAAEKLQAGPCDCEQRNWLNHFVEMGNYALSGADEGYAQSARLMATLGRNDRDAMAISHRP